MWSDDLDWLELTYPLPRGWEGSAAERAAAVERACLRRLEAIRWPEGPECPRCGTRDDAAEWRHAPRGLGWRCRGCKARFHVLRAIPAMARTHLPVTVWFRAIHLISSAPALSSIALGARLGLEQKVAWRLGRAVRRMRDECPDLVRRVVGGPAADRPARRRARERGPATARKPRPGGRTAPNSPGSPGRRWRCPAPLTRTAKPPGERAGEPAPRGGPGAGPEPPASAPCA